MSTPTTNPTLRPGGTLTLTDVEDVARSLKLCPPEPYAAIRGWLDHAAAEAEDWASHPDTPEEKRAGWCGRWRGLRDALRDLDELRTEAWRRWFMPHHFEVPPEPEPLAAEDQPD